MSGLKTSILLYVNYTKFDSKNKIITGNRMENRSEGNTMERDELGYFCNNLGKN